MSEQTSPEEWNQKNKKNVFSPAGKTRMVSVNHLTVLRPG